MKFKQSRIYVDNSYDDPIGVVTALSQPAVQWPMQARLYPDRANLIFKGIVNAVLVYISALNVT